MLLYSLTDFWFCMLKIPGVYNKDGAKRYHKSSIFNRQSSIPALPGWAFLNLYTESLNPIKVTERTNCNGLQL
jgi:hypothetical protein